MKFAALVPLLCLCASLPAQNVDSLRNVLARQRGAERLPTLVQLCGPNCRSLMPTEEAWQYGEEIIRLAPEARDTAAWVEGCLCLAAKLDKSTEEVQIIRWFREAQRLSARLPASLANALFWQGNAKLEFGRPDSAFACFNQGLVLYEHHPSLSSYTHVHLLGIAALTHSNLGHATQADSLGKLAFKYCKTPQDSAGVLSYWGRIQENLGHPEEAIRAFLGAYRTDITLSMTLQAAYNLRQAAGILRDQGRYEQAIRYFDESVALSKRINYTLGLASTYHSLGGLYTQTKDYEKALHYYRQSLAFKQHLGRPRKVMTTIQGMAELYLLTGQHDSCLALCQTSLPQSRMLGMANIESYLAFVGSISAAEMGKMDQARRLATEGEQAIKKVKSKDDLLNAYNYAARSLALLGDFEKAYRYKGLFQTMQDSVFNVEKSRIIAEMEARFDTEKKEQQIAVLAKDNQLQTTRQYALLGGLVLVGLLALALWRNTRNRRRLNEVLEKANAELTRKNHDVQTLLREIHHRVKNNLQIISSLLRLQARRVSDEGAIEALQTGQARIRSMSLLHQRLYQGEVLKDIPMRPYLNDLAQSLLDAYRVDEDRITLSTDIDELSLNVDDAVPLGLISNELITNSLKHAFPGERKGKILIVLKKNETGFRLEVADDGIGMTITDSKPVTSSTSFGLELVESLAQKLNGQLVFSNGQGTKTELFAYTQNG